MNKTRAEMGDLSKYDLVYDSPVRCWQDALTIGNGKLAALSYDADGFYPEWTVNLHSLWSKQGSPFFRHPIDHVRKIAAGELDFRTEMAKEKMTGCSRYPEPVYGYQLRLECGIIPQMAPGHRITRRLALTEGMLHLALDKHCSHIRVTSFVLPSENVLVIQVRNVSVMCSFRNRIRLYRQDEPGCAPAEYSSKKDTFALIQHYQDFSFSAVGKVVPRGGGANRELFESVMHPGGYDFGKATETAAASHTLEYSGCNCAGDFDVLLTLQQGPSVDDAVALLNRVAERSPEALAEENAQWWREFWSKNAVSLGDPALNQLWYLSNYYVRLGAGCNPGWGLCGPWVSRTPSLEQNLPWHGFYTNDYNAQTLPLSLETIHHGELAVPIFQMLHDQLPEARKNAALCGVEGALYPLSGGPDGRDVSGGGYRFCQGSGPYWCFVLYRHYKFSGDSAFLRNIAYDILRETADFFAGYMVHSADSWHLECSQNPELQYLHYQDPLDTLAFLKAALNAAIEASAILGYDPEKRARWQEIIDHFPEYPSCEKGFLPLRGLRPDHINHSRTLGAVFPTGEIDPEFPDRYLEIAKNELYNPNWSFFMQSYCCESGSQEGWTGKVYHRGIAACRLQDRELAWKYLGDMIGGTLKPNGLFSHNIAILCNSQRSEENIKAVPERQIYHDCGPDPMPLSEVTTGLCWEETTEDLECKEKMFPVLEGNAVFLLLLSEMLLQSHHGLLRVFPAWPLERSAAFRGLCAEGGACVDAQKRDSRVAFVRITASREGDFALRSPWTTETIFKNGVGIQNQAHLKFHLKRGEAVLFSDRNTVVGDCVSEDGSEAGAQARVLDFGRGRFAYVGKPDPGTYYSTLQSLSHLNRSSKIQ